ncbi:MAG TPA: glycosyltransferase family 2 protein [Pyrinomonadaceae bacterium]|nr:glycosyltransferase family 2 protein [Pyrinomonadaceae bacterium]
MKPSPQVAVIVVSYNTRDLLVSCLASVFDSTGSADIEIVVVDNASTDGSLESVRQTYPPLVTIANPANLGFGAACNQAIRATTAPFILLLNSDATITPECFQTLREVLSSDPKCGAAGCRIVNSAGAETLNTRNFLTPLNQALEQSGMMGWTSWKYLRRTHRPILDKTNQDCSVDWIDGACLMLRRAALDEVGLFDEAFFMYSEEEDLCFRLRQRSWAICYSANGTARHHGGASTSQNKADMLRHFYASQMLFLSKHRGRSAGLYAMSMKTILLFKSLLSTDPGRREIARAQLRALDEASRNNRW